MADPPLLLNELVRDAVREARGRRPVRPATTVEAAAAEVRDYLVAPEWYEGRPAADVAADVLSGLHGVEAPRAPYLWALYAEGARRLGFDGAVPVPMPHRPRNGPGSRGIAGPERRDVRAPDRSVRPPARCCAPGAIRSRALRP